LPLFFHETAPTALYTLSLHDALPILRGCLALLLLILNTLICCWPLFALSLLKLMLPFAPVQRRLRFGMHWIAETWIAANKGWMRDRKSTRLNSSHVKISYAVFCLKKK